MLSPLSCSSFLGRPWRFRWIFIFSGGRWWPAVAGGRRRGAAATVNTLFFTFFFALPLIVLFALVYQLRNHKIEPQLTRSTKKHNTKKNKQKKDYLFFLFLNRDGVAILVLWRRTASAVTSSSPLLCWLGFCVFVLWYCRFLWIFRSPFACAYGPIPFLVVSCRLICEQVFVRWKLAMKLCDSAPFSVCCAGYL